MQQGEIVLIPFPFTDLSSQKTRPALIISKSNISQDIVIVAITSRHFSNAVKIDNSNLLSGTLPIESYIRYDKVVTLEKFLIKRSVGTLKKKNLVEVIDKFKSQF